MKSTLHVENLGGISVLVPNVFQKYDGFYVSYNNRDTAIYGSDTTALVVGQGVNFYILKGDHRKHYAEIVAGGGDLSDCKDYFKQCFDQKAPYSD